jgi:hypothetical protein
MESERNVFYDLPPEIQYMIIEYAKKTLEDHLGEIPSFCWFKTRNQLDVEDGVCSECKRYTKSCWETIMISNSWLITSVMESKSVTEDQAWRMHFPRSFKKYAQGMYKCTL